MTDKTYIERMKELEKIVSTSNDVELRHSAVKAAFIASAVNRVSTDNNTALALQPFTKDIVSVCIAYRDDFEAFEPVDPKDHPEKLSKPKQKTARKIAFWNASADDAALLTKHDNMFFRSAKNVADLADYAEQAIAEGARIHSLQVLASKASDLKKAADKKAAKEKSESESEPEENVPVTPEELRAAVDAAIVRLWKAAEAAGYDNDMILELVTNSAPKPKADKVTDQLNAMRGVTDRIVKKTNAAKLTGKTKVKKAL